MKRKTLGFRKGFHLAVGNAHSQSAEMVIAAGESEGGPSNRHHGSDQWLFIVEGTGVAIVNGHRYALKPGVLMLIERNDTHELRASGKGPLRTLNLYVPPAFRDAETPLAAGRP
jgi:mannose-6-phosphate isomerase-like protein (cupin superfamily)